VGSYLAVSGESVGLRGLDRLLELQEADTATDRLGVRLRILESQEGLREAREQARDAESRLGQLKLELDEATTHQRRLESDAESLTRKMDAERARLYDGSVANPKELVSIEHEVANLRSRIGRVEDETLEVMERREELEARVADVEVEVARARDELSAFEGSAAAELVEVERELAERRAARDALVPSFDPELLALYEEIRAQKKGVAAAALQDGICQGCHQKLSPVYLDRLKRTEAPWRCEYCRRIVIAA
jgi:predicted  nucleic acid-binding Zn-ribbon protein